MALENWLDVSRMDELGRLDSPLHRLDARAKALVTVAFVVAVMSFGRREVSALVPFLAYPVWLVAAGGLPAGYLARKILAAAPFAVAVGAFNPWLDREPVAALGAWTLTGGWLSFVSILLRFALTVGAALALVACTGVHRLCAGLEGLGLPRALAAQVLFLYRYLFVIADEGGRMVRGAELRAAGGRAGLRLRVFGSLAGHLLLRSMDRAERIYRAMLARGFDGEVRVLAPGRPGWREWSFGAAWVVFFAAARRWNLAALAGGLLLGEGR